MRKRILVIVLLVLVLISGYIYIQKTSQKPKGIIWNERTIPERKEPDYIKIPGFSKLTFVANSIEQNVEIFNPIANKCNMDFRILFEDDSVLWETDGVEPGYGFETISLSKKLEKGEYNNCKFEVKCKNANGESINGASFDIKIIVR